MNSSLNEYFSQLRDGSPSQSLLYGLSNLSEKDTQEMVAVWSSLPTDIRRELIRSLVDITESDIEVSFGHVFRIALEDDDDSVREAAVEGLWEDEDVRLVPLLAVRLKIDTAPNVRAAAAQSLGRFVLLGELDKIRPLPHQQAYQALIESYRCEGERTAVLRRVLESLAYSCDEEVTAIIDEAYHHPDERMQISAVFAMGRSGDTSWGPFVLKELHSPASDMRFEAARASGELALTDAVPILLEFVDDVDPEIQEASIWALGQIGGGETRRVLVECTRTDSEAKRQVAHEALQEYELLHGDVGSLLLPIDVSEEDLGSEDSDNEADIAEQEEGTL